MKRKIISSLFALVLLVGLSLIPAVPVAAADAVVDIAAIPGVTAPAVGETPVTAITPTAQYTGTVTWSPADATFAADQVYTAIIILTAKAGFTLTGVTANFFTVAGATATNPADSGVVTAIFPATAAVVDIAAIPGVTAPVVGGTPVTEITPTAQYTGTVAWSPADATFLGETVYTATITLTAKAGFTLTGVTADFFTVAGATATNPADSGVVTAVFPATAAAVVDIAAIPGVTVPVVSGTPVTAITPTDQYTGTVAWSPADDPFAGETVYTATITLTAKAGFTLTGVTADFFTVAGATATNPADSGVVSAEFPATGVATVITTAAIPGVTAPAVGETPVTAITPTTQYTGTVAWSPADDPFAGETVYTATITLTAKAGFTLTGVTEDFFTVAGATATNPADSGVVTAIFPATAAAAVITTAAIPGVTAPAVGETPVTAITPTAQYTGTVTWSPADDPFLGEQVYEATITLTAKAGFTLTGVAEDFFTVAGATATNPADSGVVSAIFPATAAAVVDIAVIPGVTVPVVGGTPVTEITPTDQYTGTVTWEPADATFAGETVYTAIIILTAKAGFTLTGVTADFFTVAGATATNPADSGVVTAIFPATAVEVAVVDIAAIPGVTAPAVGGTPVTEITPTAQYTGTVIWSPADDPFAAEQAYTATITLTAKAGFTLTGVTADFFTVAGADSVANPADSGVVTAIFPVTYDVLLELNDGWTLFSTDKYILSSGDNTSAWVGTPTLIYRHTGDAFVEYGYDPDSAFAVLEPVEALYVKMPGGGFVGLNYSDVVPFPSSKSLVEGWNLVSSAIEDDAAAVFGPLRYVLIDGQQAIGLSTIVAQGSYNTIGGSDFNEPALTDAHWTDLAGVTLKPFDGYWAYIYADATFSVIPD